MPRPHDVCREPTCFNVDVIVRVGDLLNTGVDGKRLIPDHWVASDRGRVPGGDGGRGARCLLRGFIRLVLPDAGVVSGLLCMPRADDGLGQCR